MIHRAGDYVERDEIGRPIHVKIIGRYAVFGADHWSRKSRSWIETGWAVTTRIKSA
jgi:hypothetical protein